MYQRKIIWWTLPLIAVFCLALGMSIGALTNIINVRVSAAWYRACLGWTEAQTPVASIFQGMIEGGSLGLLFGIVLAISAAASTRCRCPFRLAATMALRVVLLSLCFWIAGGIIGWTWATVDPHSLRSVIIRASPAGSSPTDQRSFQRFAWVAGSIAGGYVSAIVSSVYAAVGLHRRWKRLSLNDAFGFAPIMNR